MRGKSVFNLFFENSTRTRTTFDIAATRLSADVITLDIARSSATKGESLLDTIANLSAMAADIFVVRHSESGAPYLIVQQALRGVGMATVTGVDHVNVRRNVLGNQIRRARLAVAHHKNICRHRAQVSNRV